jgi:hypothetical protein
LGAGVGVVVVVVVVGVVVVVVVVGVVVVVVVVGMVVVVVVVVAVVVVAVVVVPSGAQARIPAPRHPLAEPATVRVGSVCTVILSERTSKLSPRLGASLASATRSCSPGRG